ncbi:MAG: PHP domain-containing protein, partial [Patescibacteria group bacterium]
MPTPFVHLHVHSHYSLLEALPKVKALIKDAKAKGMDTFALTDNGVMYGAVEFYQKAIDEGLKPIIGMDAYLAPFGRFEKRHKIDSKPFRLVLLAETNQGYKNLMKISTVGFMEGFYYKPRVDKEVLKEFCASSDHGLIALSGSQYGEIPTLIRNGEVEKAEAVAKQYAEMFGPGHFYLELVDRPELADVRAVNAVLIEMGRKLGIPLVVTKDSFYLKPTDAEAWRVMACIKNGKTLEEYERMQTVEFDASFCSPQGIVERFADVPEAIDNTRRIADRCNVTLELGKW